MPPSLNHRILTIILAPLQSFPYASGSGNPNPKARPFHCPFRRRSTEYVLIPSESKMLHLYEARYLALLEESLLERKGLFVHFVMEPVLTDRSSSGTSFAAIYGCLVLIENIDRLDIGALVSIRGIGRVSIVDLIQLEPYFRGVVIPYQDNAYAVVGEMESKVAMLKASLHDLHSLQIKLKAPRHELLQTRVKNALVWAERGDYDDCDEAFIHSQFC